jgi:cell division FtsZ-interacting protein ZapD
MEDKIKEMYSNNHKEKMNTYYCNIQELWDIIERANLRIHRVKEGAELNTQKTFQ